MVALLNVSDLKEIYPIIKDSLGKVREKLYTNYSAKDVRLLFDVIDANLEQSTKNYAKAVFIANNALQNNASGLYDSLMCYSILKSSFVRIRNFIKAYEVNSKMELLWPRKNDSINIDYGINKSGLYAALGFMNEAINERREEFYKKNNVLAPDTDKMMSFYNDLGVYFNRLKNSDSAAGYFIRVQQLVNAKKYPAERKGHYEFIRGLAKGNLGLSFYNKGDFDKAMQLISEDVYYSLQNEKYESAFNSYNLMVECCIKKNKMNDAQKYLDTAGVLINTKLKDITPRLNYLFQQSKFLQAIGKYKEANYCWNVYFRLKDSLSMMEKEQSLLNTEIAFKIEQKELELLEKNKMLELKTLEEAREKTFRAYTIAGFVLLLAVILFLVLINSFSKKREKELSLKNEEIRIQHAQIEQALKEKEMLIKEIHHRVKNNLQIITSMLSLQISKEEGKESESILREAKQRINSIALTHQMLYQNTNLANISVNEYIENLVRQIEYSLPPTSIELITDLEPNTRKINIDNAIPLGLLINELLTNSFKHAFPNGQKGIIKISLAKIGDNCIISVSDNGVGLPEDFNLTENKSMGMDLIHILAEQLDAKLKIETNNGSSFTLLIALEKLFV